MNPFFSSGRAGWLFLAFLTGAPALLVAKDATRLPLWEGAAPGALGTAEKDQPTVDVYLPEPGKATGAAVVICPGGGYRGLAMAHEGKAIAEWLNSLGVAGFVLKYRMQGTGYGHPVPMLDAQRAVRLVRARAAEYGVDAGRVGIMGFSAGGHLASTVGTHFDAGSPEAADPIDRVSCRPDFLILCYAVIAFGEPFTHQGSQKNLIGAAATPELVRSLSNEKQVTAETPPTFLFHTDADKGVKAENSVMFYLALREHGVPAELHVYQKGGHGLGLAAKTPGTSDWSNACARWMAGLGLIKDSGN